MVLVGRGTRTGHVRNGLEGTKGHVGAAGDVRDRGALHVAEVGLDVLDEEAVVHQRIVEAVARREQGLGEGVARAVQRQLARRVLVERADGRAVDRGEVEVVLHGRTHAVDLRDLHRRVEGPRDADVQQDFGVEARERKLRGGGGVHLADAGDDDGGRFARERTRHDAAPEHRLLRDGGEVRRDGGRLVVHRDNEDLAQVHVNRTSWPWNMKFPPTTYCIAVGEKRSCTVMCRCPARMAFRSGSRLREAMKSRVTTSVRCLR